MKKLKVLISPAHYYFTDNKQVSEPRYSYCITRGVAKRVTHLDVIVGYASLSSSLPKNVKLISIYKRRSESPAVELIKYLMFYPLVCLKYLSLKRRYDVVHHMFPTSPHTVDPLLILVKLISPKTKIIIGPLQLLSTLGSPQDLSLMLVGKQTSSVFAPILPYVFNTFVKLAFPLSRLTYKTADVIVCNFQTIRRFYLKVFPEKRIEVIPTGVDGVVKKKILPKREGKITIISVGWLMVHKGQKYLLEALNLLVRKVPNARLILVGEGDLKEEYQKFVRKNKLEDKVLFTGRIPHDEVEKLYTSVDIYCLPSLIDTNPVVLMEAMSYGLPIVATDVGAVSEIVGDAGLIVKKKNSNQLYQALLALTKNRTLRLKMGNLGRERIINYYNWEEIGRKWVKLYETI